MRRYALAWAALLLVASAPAVAWNAAGHRMTAAIAWREMAPATRETVARLLADHPDQPRWLKRARGMDPAYASFLEASTWPDDIRNDRRFHDENQPAVEVLPGFPDMSRHRRWHHADHRLDNGTRTGRGELDSRLPRIMQTLADRRSAAGARSYALPWLIHLIADAHQPLHVTSRHDDAGDSDGGGNGLWVETPHHPRLREMTLHAYWDDLPGPLWLHGERLEAAAGALLQAVPVDDLLAAQATDLAGWIAESRELARTTVYAGLDYAAPVIDERYHERALHMAKQRIVLAGYRMARVLDTLLDHSARADVSRETRR